MKQQCRNDADSYYQGSRDTSALRDSDTLKHVWKPKNALLSEPCKCRTEQDRLTKMAQ